MTLETQQMTVRDQCGRFLRDLRISVIDKCNFRCPYCMPKEKYHAQYPFLKPADRLTFDEINRLASAFVALGVNKLRITGGEPLLRRDIPELVGRLRAIEGVRELALTTNGVYLARYADALHAAGLDRVTVSLDTLQHATFARMSGGRWDLDRVLEGIRAASEAGLQPLKINCVVQQGVNDSELLSLASYFRDTGHILRFIEYMDVGTCNGWRRHAVVPSAEILRRIHEHYPLEPLDAQYHGEVANRYAYRDGRGEIGFISSVSEPFCGACTRARLSADGQLYTCLFASHGADLRGPLRDGARDRELEQIIAGVWRMRADRYSELRAANGNGRRRVEMFQIGG